MRAADLVADHVAEERGRREQRQRDRPARRPVGPGRCRCLLGGDEHARARSSRVSPGRNGKNSPHSTKMMARLIQRSAAPNWSSSHSGSIQLMPSSRGCRSALTPRTVPGDATNSGHLRSLAGMQEPEEQTRRAPYDPMPHGPAEVGVGPWAGPLARRARSTTPRCSPRATGATWSTGTATGRWRRSSPTSTPGATTSTWRSRTGSTTSTSARSSGSANAFLAAEVHIVGNRRWNRRGAMVTDRYQHVRHHATAADLAAYLHELPGGPVALLGIDNLPGSQHLETMTVPRRVCFLFGQEGPGLSERRARGRATGRSRSRSSARRGRSTPPRPPRSRCTPGSGSTPTCPASDAWRG